MADESTFVCRACGSRQFFHAGVTSRAFQSQKEGEDPSLNYETVHYYACGGCTSLFVMPPAFSVADSIETVAEEELPPTTHPHFDAEDD
jgi:hypothetical protein